MPKFNKNFSKSKMNRDMDERIIPDGEYREALNIQISSSESADVGTAQTLLGNVHKDVPYTANEEYSYDKTFYKTGYGAVPANSTCVGSVVDTKNDKLYWLVAGARLEDTFENPDIRVINRTEAVWKDYILEYDLKTDEIKYVFVDIYRVNVPTVGTAGAPDRDIPVTLNGTVTDGSRFVRRGMRVTAYPTSFTNPPEIPPSSETTVTDSFGSEGPNGTVNIYSSYTDWDTTEVAAGTINFTADRVLNFDKDRMITGINIIDGMLFWTDDYSEPKKINIKRSIGGTGGNQNVSAFPTVLFTGDNDHYHTRLCITPDSGSDLQIRSTDNTTLASRKKTVVFVEEEHVTVIRQAPLKPPRLLMSNTESLREDALGNANPIATTSSAGNGGIVGGVAANSFIKGNNPIEPKEPGDTVSNVMFDSPVDFRVGDMIICNQEEDTNFLSFTDHDVRMTVVFHPVNGSSYVSGPQPPSAGPYNFEIQSIDGDTIDEEDKEWKIKLEQSKPLFEFKFPRFSYRYKYEDGEYSTFAPWSRIAFLPGDYDYLPKKGFNLGMTNQLRNLRITDYAPEQSLIPQDIISIDILYKESNSPNVYTVKTINRTDEHPAWPLREDTTHSDYDFKARGLVELESELIHATVPSNQLLRQWDNVPRVAKAQEISGNRLVYGNYLQNYDIKHRDVVGYDKSISPDIQLTLSTKIAALNVPNPQEGTPTPERSIKTLRTYQAGVVYGDKYGRETPVLVGDPIASTLKVEKENAPTINSLNVKINSSPPDWAKYWKIFIKETSNEYYNLAMDRWYNAEDGNIWLSFQSADRNKVDEETFLILKKQHDNHIPVTDKARYKILAISNDAPDFIKIEERDMGRMDNNTSKTWIGNSAGTGFPFKDTTFLYMNKTAFDDEFDQGAVIKNIQAGSSWLRVVSNTGIFSNWYKVNKINEIAGGYYKLEISGKFEEDVEFASPAQTLADRQSGLSIQIIEKLVENRPEFDGRFFVKIYKDLVLVNNLLKAVPQEYSVVGSTPMHYFRYPDWSHSVGGCLGCDCANWESQALANNLTSGNCNALSGSGFWYGANCTTIPSKIRTCTRKDRTNEWWAKSKNVFFIDNEMSRSSASEYNGGFTSCNDNTKGGRGRSPLTNAGKKVRISYVDGNASNAIDSTTAAGQLASTILTPGTLFRFREDPDHTLWKVTNGNWLSFNGTFSDHDDANGNSVKHTMEVSFEAFAVADANGDYTAANTAFGWGSGPSSYSPIGTVAAGVDGRTVNELMHTSSLGGNDVRHGTHRKLACLFHTLEIVEPYFGDDSKKLSSENPATWETEPKEDVGMDIYYEATQALPMTIDASTNELFASFGSIVSNESGAWGGATSTVSSWSDNTVTITSVHPVNVGDIISFHDPLEGITTRAVCDMTSANTNNFTLVKYSPPAHPSGNTALDTGPHNQVITLPYSNCYSFGNGIESDRIRDDFNQVRIGKGVKASTVMAEKYAEDRRKAGLIHSGIYNSTSGVNRLNQFIQAEPITKDINPQYGSIQKLHTRDTNIVVFCEDKVWKVLADKNILFNPDGSSNVAKASKFLGAATTFAGEFGISSNPESFASHGSRLYFSDRNRGNILRLSGDGITNISNYGMKDWFSDNLIPLTEKVVGSYDERKDLYNVTIHGLFPVSDDAEGGGGDQNSDNPCGDCETSGQGNPSTQAKIAVDDDGRAKQSGSDRAQVYVDRTQANFMKGDIADDETNQAYYKSFATLSFSEQVKGWVSFKSFKTDSALTLNNEYFTFFDGELFKHHANEVRNNFYGVQYDSQIKMIFNGSPEIVKSFGSLSYEGSQAKVTFSDKDKEYYNLFAKDGWYVESVESDLQSASNIEFKNKEGKWFSKMRGVTTTLGNLDESEFSVQGIGAMGSYEYDGEPKSVHCLTVEPVYIDGCKINRGCTDINASNYDPTATVDDGSCIYCVYGCTDDTAPNYNGDATCDDGSCIYLGCTDPAANNYDPTATVNDGSCDYTGVFVPGCTDQNAFNYNAAATIDDGSCCYEAGCTDPTAGNYDPAVCHDDGSCLYYGCTDPTALNFDFAQDASHIDDGSCNYCIGLNFDLTINDSSGNFSGDGSIDVNITNLPGTDATGTSQGYWAYLELYDNGGNLVSSDWIVNTNAAAGIGNQVGFYTGLSAGDSPFTIDYTYGPLQNDQPCSGTIPEIMMGSTGQPSVGGCTYGTGGASGYSTLPTWNAAINDGGPNAGSTWLALYGIADPTVQAPNFNALATYDDGSCAWPASACQGNLNCGYLPFEQNLIDTGIITDPNVDGVVDWLQICSAKSLVMYYDPSGTGLAQLSGGNPFGGVLKEMQDATIVYFKNNVFSTHFTSTNNEVNSIVNPSTLIDLKIQGCRVTGQLRFDNLIPTIERLRLNNPDNIDPTDVDDYDANSVNDNYITGIGSNVNAVDIQTAKALKEINLRGNNVKFIWTADGATGTSGDNVAPFASGNMIKYDFSYNPLDPVNGKVWLDGNCDQVYSLKLAGHNLTDGLENTQAMGTVYRIIDFHNNPTLANTGVRFTNLVKKMDGLFELELRGVTGNQGAAQRNFALDIHELKDLKRFDINPTTYAADAITTVYPNKNLSIQNATYNDAFYNHITHLNVRGISWHSLLVNNGWFEVWGEQGDSSWLAYTTGFSDHKQLTIIVSTGPVITGGVALSNVNYQGASWDLPAQTTVKEFVQFFWGTDNSNTTDTASLQAANPGSQYQGNYITKYSLNPLDRSQPYEIPFIGSGPTATSNPNYKGPNINVIT